MLDSVNILTQAEILLESDMLRVLITAYIFLFAVLFMSFLNIYSVDKIEFLINQQKRLQFKHKLFFLITYSKNKYIVSKKTLILELIGYLIAIASIIIFICSLKQDVTTACILLTIVAVVNFIFGCVTGGMYWKVKKYK